MRIAIDARPYAWTGVGRYIRNLLREYDQISTPHTFVILVPRGELEECKARLNLSGAQFEYVEVEGSYYSLAEQTTLLWELINIRADLFHFTHFNIPLLFNRPYVVTIHDTTRFIFPGQREQGFLQQLAYETVFAHAVQAARGIITVSNTTKQELQALPFRLPKKVEVIYEGVGEEFFASANQEDRQAARALLGTVSPFLLYVGVWMSHKNLLRLLSAFSLVRKEMPDLKLVITGTHRPDYVDVQEEVDRLGLSGSVLLPGFVPAQYLPALYAEATCLTFPSLYEGFGLPAIEAAAQGLPVVTAGVSSMPEVMGDAALYVNPEDTADITRGILEVIKKPAVATLLKEKGQRQARAFHWRQCAEATLSLYEACG